jgi:UDP-N-acetylmuramate--alanine ligase
MKDYKTLSVTGTHGKTTTTALLTTVLMAAKMNPSYAVGGIVNQLHSNAGHGQGECFVAEADESDGTFLKYDSYGAIVTNIDFDHMNHFKTESNLISSFAQFIKQVRHAEHLFWCGDDERLKRLYPPGTSYGFNSECALRAVNIAQHGWQQFFDIQFQGKHYTNIALNLIGKHNVLNALAVFGLSTSLGITEEVIRRAFATFEGVARRCEKKADLGQILILDDYAHHPTEIKTTLSGIRAAIGNRRLIVAFQCHRYTRTKDCMGSFGGIFDSVDHLVMTDLYTAQESSLPGVTVEAVIKEIQQHSPKLPIHYASRSILTEYLAEFIKPNDVVVTMGAGDITKIGAELVL